MDNDGLRQYTVKYWGWSHPTMFFLQLEDLLQKYRDTCYLPWQTVSLNLLNDPRKESFSSVQFSSVQSLSRVPLFATPWIAARQASLSITNSRSLLKLMPIESVMPSSHLILCHPLLLLHPVPPNIRVFSNESTLLMRWPKYWSFSLSISPSDEHPGLIAFRVDWFGSPCSPRDSQESSPTPWFKSINSSVLSFPHSPTLTSIHDRWKNHSLDQTDLIPPHFTGGKTTSERLSEFFKVTQLLIDIPRISTQVHCTAK